MTGRAVGIPRGGDGRHFQRNDLYGAEQARHAGFVVGHGGENARDGGAVSVVVGEGIASHSGPGVVVVAVKHAAVVQVLVEGRQAAVDDGDFDARAVQARAREGVRVNGLVVAVLEFVVSVVMGQSGAAFRVRLGDTPAAVRAGSQSNIVLPRRRLQR